MKDISSKSRSVIGCLPNGICWYRFFAPWCRLYNVQVIVNAILISVSIAMELSLPNCVYAGKKWQFLYKSLYIEKIFIFLIVVYVAQTFGDAIFLMHGKCKIFVCSPSSALTLQALKVHVFFNELKNILAFSLIDSSKYYSAIAKNIESPNSLNVNRWHPLLTNRLFPSMLCIFK